VTARTITLPDAGDVAQGDLGVNSVVHEYLTIERHMCAASVVLSMPLDVV
jgi:hypothetical protein